MLFDANCKLKWNEFQKEEKWKWKKRKKQNKTNNNELLLNQIYTSFSISFVKNSHIFNMTCINRCKYLTVSVMTNARQFSFLFFFFCHLFEYNFFRVFACLVSRERNERKERKLNYNVVDLFRYNMLHDTFAFIVVVDFFFFFSSFVQQQCTK